MRDAALVGPIVEASGTPRPIVIDAGDGPQCLMNSKEHCSSDQKVRSSLRDVCYNGAYYEPVQHTALNCRRIEGPIAV